MSSVRIKASTDAASSSSEAGSASEVGSNASASHDRRARKHSTSTSKPSLAGELHERVEQGRWDIQRGPLITDSPEEEEDNEEDALAEHDAVALALATSLARQKTLAQAGRKPSWWDSIVYSPDVEMALAWARVRLRPVRAAWRAVRQPVFLAWLAIVLQASTLLATALHTNSGKLRPEDGPVAAVLGTLAFLCAISSASVGRSLRTIWGGGGAQGSMQAQHAKPIKALPNGLPVHDMAILRTLRTAKVGSALPVLWLAVLVGTVSTWARAALVLGLPPLGSVLVLTALACDILLDVADLRGCMTSAMETVTVQLASSLPLPSIFTDGRRGQGVGQATGESGEGEAAARQAEEPAGLSTLGLREAGTDLLPEGSTAADVASSSPQVLPDVGAGQHPASHSYEALSRGVPARFRAVGWSAVMDRGVSILCMLAGVARALCPVFEPYSAPDEAELSVGQGDPSFADTLFALAREDHALRVGACRDMHAHWSTWAMMVIALAFSVYTVAKLFRPAVARSQRHKEMAFAVSRGALLAGPALAVLALVGLPLSHNTPASAFTQWGAQGPDMPGALYGTCDATKDAPVVTALSHHSGVLLLLAAFAASWCIVTLADSAFLAVALLHADSIPNASSVTVELRTLPAAHLGMMLTVALVTAGCLGMTAAATAAVAADALGPLPYFGVFLCVMAGCRHAVSALDGVEQLVDKEYNMNKGVVKDKGQ